MITKIIEIVRIIATAFGVFWSYYSGDTPQEVLHIMSPWVIIAIAGTSGLEGIFFGKQGAIEKGFKPGGNYQIQSAIALLSYGFISFVVYYLGWGTNAELTIVFAFLFFMIFSAINHTKSIIIDKNYKWANLNRPFLAIMLVAIMWWPVMGSL